jgi:hypothetical protein
LHPDDVLYSLRKGNQVYLSFVVNNGILGESRGRANSKPDSKHHPCVVELLQHDSFHVVGISGGGRNPELNFALSDLGEEAMRRVLSISPIRFDPFGDRWAKRFLRLRSSNGRWLLISRPEFPGAIKGMELVSWLGEHVHWLVWQTPIKTPAHTFWRTRAYMPFLKEDGKARRGLMVLDSDWTDEQREDASAFLRGESGSLPARITSFFLRWLEF